MPRKGRIPIPDTEITKKWREEHPGEILTPSMKYQINNPKKRCASSKKWRDGHPEQRRAQVMRHQNKDPEKYKTRMAADRQRVKFIVLSYYSGGKPRCSCPGCNETEINRLCMDHVNGGGRNHREKENLAGSKIYRWLMKNNFPPGYRVLCHNCNSSLGYYGYCPHNGKETRILTARQNERRRLKFLVISAYGGKCKCGERRIEFLCIDHINGGGTKHIVGLLKNRRDLYTELKKNGFPPGYQVLCQCCNQAKNCKIKNE